jgi:hypothetical protein
MWYHHVRQEGVTIAVNYWYDMQFDTKFAYHQFAHDTFLASPAAAAVDPAVVEAAVEAAAACRGSQFDVGQARAPYRTVRGAGA